MLDFLQKVIMMLVMMPVTMMRRQKLLFAQIPLRCSLRLSLTQNNNWLDAADLDLDDDDCHRKTLDL